MNQLDAERGWKRMAGRSARKVNLAWWLQAWSPLVVFAALLAFTAVFYLRSTGWVIDPEAAAAWISAGVLAAAILALVLARRNFQSREIALVRLESLLGLNNSLTTADHGLGPWPEAPRRVADGMRWKGTWLWLPPLLAIGLVTAAFCIPVTPEEERSPLAPPEPTAWSRMEDQIKKLEKSGIADNEDLGQIEEKIEQLRSTPQQDWFSAASLEATQSLDAAFNQGLRKMSNDMSRADHNLGSLAKFGDQMTARAKARAAEDFRAAVENLNAGKLKPNKELRDQLEGIDPGKLGDLPPEQLQQLREQLQKNADALRRVAGRAGAGQAPWEEGNGEPGGQGDPNQPPGEGDPEGEDGRGGIQEGPGHAPLQLGDKTDLGTDKPEGIESNDLKRAAAGDLLDEIAGGHEVDRTKVGPRAGGTIASPGSGGETVGRDQLLPAEKAVLRNYFE